MPARACTAPACSTLRVGYISPDFFTHSVSYFAEAPLTQHRPSGRTDAWGAPNPHVVQQFAYCCAPKQDAKTTRLRSMVEAVGGVW